MNEFAVAAIGEDRPGIVAAVSEALLAADASIEDSSMTILGGHFAMLLLVTSGGLDAAGLEQVLAPVADELALLLEVRRTSRDAAAVTSVCACPAGVWPIRPPCFFSIGSGAQAVQV